MTARDEAHAEALDAAEARELAQFALAVMNGIDIADDHPLLHIAQ